MNNDNRALTVEPIHRPGTVCIWRNTEEYGAKDRPVLIIGNTTSSSIRLVVPMSRNAPRDRDPLAIRLTNGTSYLIPDIHRVSVDNLDPVGSLEQINSVWEWLFQSTTSNRGGGGNGQIALSTSGKTTPPTITNGDSTNQEYIDKSSYSGDDLWRLYGRTKIRLSKRGINTATLAVLQDLEYRVAPKIMEGYGMSRGMAYGIKNHALNMKNKCVEFDEREDVEDAISNGIFSDLNDSQLSLLKEAFGIGKEESQ